MKKLSFLIVVINVFWVYNASAEQQSLKVSGFGTLATATADTSTYQYRNDRSQAAIAKKGGFALKPLSLLGVQIDYSVSNKLDFVGQFVYREQDRQNIDSITQMAFFRYDVTPSWQVRGGRLAADLFHFSDTRDISIAYPWVKVPTEVYGIVPARSFDGADISYLQRYGDFNLTVKVFWGRGESDFTSSEYSPIEFKNLRSLGIQLSAFDWSIALKHTQTEAENDNADSAFVATSVAQLQPLWSGAIEFADALSLRNATIYYSSLYLNRNFGDWEFSAELAHTDSESIGLRPALNGFLNISYLYGAHTFYGLYSFASSDTYYLSEENPEFPINESTAVLATYIEEIGSTLAHSQKSLSVGWRWDLQESLAFKVQFERTDIDARGGGLRARDGLVINGEDGVAHTLFLALSFSF